MKTIKILTPENIDIEYRLAGLFSRAAAVMIDILIQVLAVLIIAGTFILIAINNPEYLSKYEDLGGWIIAGLLMVLFIINYGYFIIFEMTMNGKTPGKKLLKLRVLRDNGQPITLKHSVVRNLFRIFIDYYGIGTILILFTKKFKRVGDYAASTIVISEEDRDITNPLDKINIGKSSKYILTNEERRLLKDYHTRKNFLKDQAESLERELGEYFSKKYDLDNTYKDYGSLLKELIDMR